MSGNVDDVYEKLSDVMSRDEFDAEVEALRTETGGLMEPDVVGMMVLDKHGRSEIALTPIRDLEDRGEATVRGKVASVGPVREFNKRSGGRGRVANVELEDESGKCRIVLWDDDVELVENGELKPGMDVTLVHGYVKVSKYGVEVSKGRAGVIVVGGKVTSDRPS